MSEPASDAPGDRIDEFEAELAPSHRSTSPTTEERLLVAGLAAMPIGLVLIVIGYIGASGTTEFSSQVPYLISGGLLGLGLIVVGGVLFLRYSFAALHAVLAAAPHLRGAHEQRDEPTRRSHRP